MKIYYKLVRYRRISWYIRIAIEFFSSLPCDWNSLKVSEKESRLFAKERKQFLLIVYYKTVCWLKMVILLWSRVAPNWLQLRRCNLFGSLEWNRLSGDKSYRFIAFCDVEHHIKYFVCVNMSLSDRLKFYIAMIRSDMMKRYCREWKLRENEWGRQSMIELKHSFQWLWCVLFQHYSHSLFWQPTNASVGSRNATDECACTHYNIKI